MVGVCDKTTVGKVAYRFPSIAFQGHNVDCEPQRGGFAGRAQQEQSHTLQQDSQFESAQHLSSSVRLDR